jgi:hypothetical protein
MKLSYTPQMGIAKATRLQAVCVVTEEEKKNNMVARVVDAFMMNG